MMVSAMCRMDKSDNTRSTMAERYLSWVVSDDDDDVADAGDDEVPPEGDDVLPPVGMACLARA